MAAQNDLAARIDPERLAKRALDMVAIASPTGQTREVAEYYADVYTGIGCDVTMLSDIPRAPAGIDAPSVAARFAGGGTGMTLQFDGHSDTIPVEHEPASIVDGVLHGRGAADMKGGLAATMEMVEVLKEAGVQLPGDLLLTTHGLHEAPDGHGEGLQALVDAGHAGDRAVVAEGPCDVLAISGRGMSIFDVEITGPGASAHENETPYDTPHLLTAAGEMLVALAKERERLLADEREFVGPETLFVGQVHGGDFYNRFPTVCRIQGTRRYFADHSFEDIEGEFRKIADVVAFRTGTTVEFTLDRIRDGYQLDERDPIVRAVRAAYQDTEGSEMSLSAFNSVGDVSILTGVNGIPAVYCGSRGSGVHADHESVSIAELVRQTAVLLRVVERFYGLA